MAITHNEVKITWDTGSNTDTIATATATSSDDFSFNTAAVAAGITLKADNQGTPASGDTVDFYLLYSAGDPDAAASADEFASTNHPVWIGQIDTNDGINPAVLSVGNIDVTFKKMRLYTVNNGASTVIVGAVVTEIRA